MDRFTQYDNHEDETSDNQTSRKRRPPMDYLKCGIPVGAVFEYIKDPSEKVTVLDGRHVEYKGQKTYISSVAKELLGGNYNVAGQLYFLYNGILVNEYYQNMFDNAEIDKSND